MLLKADKAAPVLKGAVIAPIGAFRAPPAKTQGIAVWAGRALRMNPANVVQGVVARGV